MSQQLISRSNDLKKLRDEGYEIEVKNGYLIVHHIPYVASNGEVKFGKLIVQLTLASNYTTAKPQTHVINFMGEHPCHKDGSILASIQHAPLNQSLFDGLIMNFSFSNKPPNGYDNYYHQVTRYIEIISSPAQSIDSTVTAKTFKLIIDKDDDSVFQYVDTNSSRANIFQLNSKFKGQKIAIIGLGGTGAYILDLVSKTPVDEIHLFDGDDFLQHNAFRCPGAASSEQLDAKMKKVDYLAGQYSKIHKCIFPHAEYVTEGNLAFLNQMSYVFICVDKNSIRNLIINHLKNQTVTFIDVGLGVNTVDDELIGTVRVTVGTPVKNDHLSNRISGGDNDNNEYATNIQIADLNALNAILAVIKWKKLSAFYQDLEQEHHCTYSINVAQLLNADLTI